MAKKKRKKGGRPKIEWKRIEPELIKLLTDGMSQAKACKCVGVSEETLIKYKQSNSGYSERLEASMMETHKMAHKSVKVGMVRDWRAGAWWLERTEPERFREKKEIEVKEMPNLVFDVFDEEKKDE
jgi:hypothetical protein